MSTGDAAARAFQDVFGREPETTASAPGRVNLLGEHTDYHEGYVLPATIPQRTHATIAARSDRVVRAWSSGAGDRDGVEQYALGSESRGRGWLDYVQGLTAALAARQIALPGFDLHLVSTVPIGGGVSSSAALEISVLRALRSRFALPLDDVALARIGRAAENDFVGAPVGIMDQMASSLGRGGEALFLDTRTLAVERIPLPAAIELMVIDSGVAHQHAGGEYAIRRRESFEAAAQLGVPFLRDADVGMLGAVERLAPVLGRRARHVITENQRVLEAVAALRAGDADTMGRLMNESHASMRDDYETSTPEIDVLVEIARAQEGVYGARLTGGGFGGAIAAIVRAGAAANLGARVAQAYTARTGRRAAVIVPSGAHFLKSRGHDPSPGPPAS
ncbi:MAG TPA: galactokinase [Vicinamibacterales bacterium]|nr:galactokinase [Vicinamibacterales bacterium]